MVIVERDAELGQLVEWLIRSENQEGSVTMLEGPIGCGKTELLRAFGDRAKRQGISLKAFCTRSEQHVPLSTVDQLLHNAILAGGGPRQTIVPAELTRLRDRAKDRSGHEMMRDLTATLLRISGRTPVTVTVDDVHLADAESLRCLDYLVHRLCASRIFAVFSGQVSTNPDNQRFRAEVQRLPHAHQLTLGPLSREATAEFVAVELPVPAGHALIDDIYEVSAGNPLLVRGLVAETRRRIARDGGLAPTGLTGGKDFGQFILCHLRHTEPDANSVVEGLAVLGPEATPKSVADLVGIDTATVSQILYALDAARVVEGHMLRHPLLAQAVRSGMPGAERAALHRRAAEQLFKEDAPPLTVAHHLLLSDRIDGHWEIPALKEAARQALLDDQVECGLDCLNAALRACTDDNEIGELRAIRARAERRNDMSAPFRITVGHEAAPQAARAELLEWLRPSATKEEVLDTLERLGLVRLPFPSPPIAERLRNASTVIATSTGQERLATRALITILTRGIDDQAIDDAQRLLHSSSLTEYTVDGIVLALLTLVYADRLHTARFWCDLFLRQTESRNAKAWQASFAAVRAEIALRHGDLDAVLGYARSTLDLVAKEALGTSVGLSLAALVRAATELGRHEEAADLLNRPIPQAMFETRFGLHYRSSRGHHYLSTGRLRAALEEFRYCGESMREWGIDQPSLVPWRSEEALVLLRLGRKEKARKLAARQLELVTEGTRSSGISLYVMALTCEADEQRTLLREAVRTLEDSGDRLHLVQALTSLAQVTERLGDTSKARSLIRHAENLSVRSGAAEPPARTPAAARPDAARLSTLSEAETRVAMLAATGFSNREISGRLYITVSTVEQHLTRIYRKLDVSRRTELAKWLGGHLATGEVGPLGGLQAS